MDPVVIAFIRGMVMVGEVAWAVKGTAAPDLIRLPHKISSQPKHCKGSAVLPLGKCEAGVMRIDKVAVIDSVVRRDEGMDMMRSPPERIHDHEDDLVEDGRNSMIDCRIIKAGLPRQERFIGEETGCKGQQA